MRRVIGVNTWVWVSPLSDETLARLARKAHEMGFGALELPIEAQGEWDPITARTILEEFALAPYVVGAMSPGRDLVDAPASTITETQQYLVGCIEVAREIGSSTVAGPFYSSTGRTWPLAPGERDTLTQQLRESLAPVIDAAQEAGVTLAIEPLNRYETSFINTVEQALDALDPLLGPGLGLALDSYHLNIEEKDLNGSIRSAAGHVAHVQVSGNDRGAVGEDHIDWPYFLDALDDAGYSGPLNLESFTAGNETIATAASIWRPLASSQDALAERTLAYLTGLQDSRE
jgi:D-psicose/D-tagatose/L-ribulose 3-epimerase